MQVGYEKSRFSTNIIIIIIDDAIFNDLE